MTPVGQASRLLFTVEAGETPTLRGNFAFQILLS